MFKKIIQFVKNSVSVFFHIPLFFVWLYHFALFFILLISFLIEKFYSLFIRIPLFGYLFLICKYLWMHSLARPFNSLLSFIDKTRVSEVSRSYLIHVGYKNLMEKRARSLVTILGMSVGMGVIVFLLSLGYGIEKLIINKVASLEELKIIDVATGENTALRLNGTFYHKIKGIENVKEVLPIISVVGRVNYNKATTDVLVYSASRNYMDLTKLKLKNGNFFASYLLDTPIENVSGASSTIPTAILGTKIHDGYTIFDIVPQFEVPAWSACSVNSSIVGYVSRLQGGYHGVEYWGSSYETNNDEDLRVDNNTGQYLGKWIKTEMPLYEASGSSTLQPKVDRQGKPVYDTVCIQQKYVQKYGEYSFADVLGESTSSAELQLLTETEGKTLGLNDSLTNSEGEVLAEEVVASSGGNLEFVSLASSSSATLAKTKQRLSFKDEPSHQAVVSLGLIKLLNIPEHKAVGTKFNVSYIISKTLYPEIEGKILTDETEYQIVGVIEDDQSQYFYIPFADMQQLGIKNYSQLKVLVDDKSNLASVRKHIDTFGFKTASTIDTVGQIESLFSNLRIVLVLLGMVALGVASLGMFNTLTVSLLERTREIGGMKTMGMVSSEVQDLFLAEAMIMGLSGGIGGVIMGYSSGKLVSFIISMVALSRGQGYLELAYVPTYLVIVIIVFSFIVGVLTGIYPAQRAKKISALNALRYE